MRNVKNLLVAQSGGPTAAINASLAGVITGGKKSEKVGRIYGAIHGIDGILEPYIISVDDVDLTLLKQTPAAYLGSCRNKLPSEEEDPAIYKRIFQVLEEYNIGYFLYIGGNDSMDTVSKLVRYAENHQIDISIIGIPKTIDNDLDLTDHTPGFGSAAKFIATLISEITQDSNVYSAKSVTIVEVMGRHAGWLTGATALARETGVISPHLIYLPEVPFSKNGFVRDIKEKFSAGVKNIIVAVSEGVKDSEGRFICDGLDSSVDAFGHTMLSGTGKVLEKIVTAELGCKVRSVEINVPQRCAGHLLSKTDIDEAYAIGEAGAVAAVSGETGKMMAYERISNNPYQIRIKSVSVHGVANKERMVPPEYIDGRHDVTPAMIEYLKPLIQGEMTVWFREGLPVYLYRN